MKLTKKKRLLLRKKRISKDRHKRRKLKKLKDNIEIYRNDPIKFAEDYLGIKLNSFQKALLKYECCMSMTLPYKNGFIDVVNEFRNLKY